MTKPQIQYATTTDGVSIAYWTLGEGEPYIIAFTPGGSSIELEWEFPEAQWAYTQLAQHRTVVRLDFRGDGLSSHPGETLSLEGFCHDLDAVVDRLGVRRYALHGGTFSTKIVLRHAAAHPDQVSALTLFRPTVATGSTHPENPAVRLLAPLADAEPEIWAELIAVALAGLDDPAFTRRFARYLRVFPVPAGDRVVGPDLAGEARRALIAADAASDLPNVVAPALVLHRKTRWFDINISRAIAAALPNGQMAVVEGSLPYPWDPPMVETIQRFLGGAPQPVSGLLQSVEAAGVPEGTAVILFADIVDSTALTEQLGDAVFRRRARELDATLRAAIAENGGRTIEGKVLGDGVMAVFNAARHAINAAIRCREAAIAAELSLHLGIHAGDVIQEETNVYGGAVNIASRICVLSAPDEILVSATVRDLARTSAGVTFEDRGEHALKGVADAQRVYAVRSQE
ncbi:MAG: adenylate/guanylate cyclase domain-containing protein [Chloroflexota bacterium]|nr:adenylate/guanylate cyclase domain-containing protein [Chloroflexota bacterium]